MFVKHSVVVKSTVSLDVFNIDSGISAPLKFSCLILRGFPHWIYQFEFYLFSSKWLYLTATTVGFRRAIFIL